MNGGEADETTEYSSRKTYAKLAPCDSERVIGNSTLIFCSVWYVNRKLRDSLDERKGKDAGKLEFSSLEVRCSVFFLEAQRYGSEDGTFRSRRSARELQASFR